MRELERKFGAKIAELHKQYGRELERQRKAFLSGEKVNLEKIYFLPSCSSILVCLLDIEESSHLGNSVMRRSTAPGTHYHLPLRGGTSKHEFRHDGKHGSVIAPRR